jgi:hypothetical protein
MDEVTDRRMRRGRRWTIASVAGLAVLLAACGSSTSSSRVVVIGDSVTSIEHADLAQALDPPYTTTFLIRSGGRITALADELRSTGQPDVAIVNVGTVDALHPVNGTDTAGDPLAPVENAANGISCVVLTTINVDADHHGGDDVAARINHRIAVLGRSDPTRYKVVDWNHFVATLPAASVSTYVQPDGIHETVDGAQWLATADLAAVRACGTTHQPTVIGANNA